MFYIFGLVLHVIIFHPETSFAMDTKCAIKSSCSPLGCHPPEHTDPITVNPASNITLNCTIITGELVRNMTWNQTLKRVKNSTGTKLSNLVLEQSNSTKSDGKYSCRCTTIKLARALTIVKPFTSSPNDIFQDAETEIKCVFSGWPLPQTVHWFKNSRLITNGTEGIYHSLQRKEHLLYSILRLPSGHEKQEGDYLCNATNSIPGWSSNINRTIEMIYECPIPKGPTISDPEMTEISARIFSNVNLTCLIDWHPDYVDECPKDQLWYFSEALPRNGTKYNQYLEDTGSKCQKKFVLSIFNVTQNDEGTYSCHFICDYRNTTKAAVDLKVIVQPPTEVPTSTEYKTTSSQSHNILAYSDSKSTESRRKWLQAALVSSAGIVVILAALCVWFVVKGKRTSSSFKPKSDCSKEKEFINQLFISHSSKDFGWVTENLVSIIEKHSIAYSIHNRDFELGKPIVQNMADSVYGSRQVLIVLSENYLASNFCREELHMAVQREADAHDSSLILVMINKLKKKQLPAPLRKKRLLDFDKHKKKEDWEEKMLREISDGELISVV